METVCFPSVGYLPTGPYGVITQKKNLDILIAVRISNLVSTERTSSVFSNIVDTLECMGNARRREQYSEGNHIHGMLMIQ
jgi:hypothetical protein